MAKYLVHGKYVGDGPKGLLKDGGSGRVAALKKLFESLGGPWNVATGASANTAGSVSLICRTRKARRQSC